MLDYSKVKIGRIIDNKLFCSSELKSNYTMKMKHYFTQFSITSTLYNKISIHMLKKLLHTEHQNIQHKTLNYLELKDVATLVQLISDHKLPL